MWAIFKVFIEFVTILLLYYFSVFWPRGIWDLTAPGPESESVLPALEAGVSTTGPPEDPQASAFQVCGKLLSDKKH